jgi:hypothetical protein
MLSREGGEALMSTVKQMPGYWDVHRCGWVLPEPAVTPTPRPFPAAAVPAAAVPEPREGTSAATVGPASA